jgi:hypothetical protein
MTLPQQRALKTQFTLLRQMTVLCHVPQAGDGLTWVRWRSAGAQLTLCLALMRVYLFQVKDLLRQVTISLQSGGKICEVWS